MRSPPSPVDSRCFSPRESTPLSGLCHAIRGQRLALHQSAAGSWCASLQAHRRPVRSHRRLATCQRDAPQPLTQKSLSVGLSRHETTPKTGRATVYEIFRLAILLLYLHVVEMIDAIEVQLAQSVAVPPMLQLRSAFEAYLQLEWMLKDDTKRRVYAYLVYDIRHRIRIYRSLDTSVPEGRQHQAMIARDKWAQQCLFPRCKTSMSEYKTWKNY